MTSIEKNRFDNETFSELFDLGPNGDEDGVPLGQCAIRMAKAGADLVGLNCFFDPFIMLECIKVMKEALDGQDLKPFLMSQPLGFRDPDAGEQGWNSLPEYPYALEPRLITRIEAQCLKKSKIVSYRF